MSRMPIPNEEDSSKTMAVSCSTTTLPSIRELLPDHVHAIRDPSPPGLPYQQSLSAPISYQEWPERPRTLGRRSHSSYSHSPPRIQGPREAGPRSILNDPIPHPSPVSIHRQQPVRHSPTPSAAHYQSSHPNPQNQEQVLPPIQNFHRRPDEFPGYPPGYEQQPVLESPHHMSRTFPMIPSSSTPASPAASQPIPYPPAAPNPHYGVYRAPYGGEVDYSSPHAINRHNSPSRVATSEVSEGGRHKKRRGNLPKPVTDILRAWFHEHLDHPYPSEEDKQMFITRTGLTISQISNWFINARRRQLPALRDKARAAESAKSSRQVSPTSDEEKASGSPSDSSPVNR